MERKGAGFACDFHGRLRTEERRHIDQRAGECGIKPSEYVRRLIAADMGRTPSFQSLEERQLRNRCIHEVSKIGNNINQIVRDYHNNFYSMEQKEDLKRLMERIIEKMDEVFPAS